MDAREAAERLDAWLNGIGPYVGNWNVSFSDDLRAVLSAIPQWRPIAEAPKDGTEFLAYFDFIKFGPGMCRWNVERAYWDCDIGLIRDPAISPTHWQPLPPPPTGEAQ